MTMFYKNKLVLVTGGAGFVGSHITEELLKQGAKVRVTIHCRPMPIKNTAIQIIKADLSQPDDCLRAVRGVDYIFHAAGAVGSASSLRNNPMEMIALNLILTCGVLQAAWQSGTRRILVFGSSTGYPNVKHPVKEDEMWNAPPPDVYCGYGWMRRYIEKLAEYTHTRSKTKISLIRPAAIYGPRDNFNPGTSHVIPALIKKAINKDDPYVVWGTGNEIRDFLHVTDLAKGCLLMLEKHADCQPVNIASGKGVSIKETAKIILKTSGYLKARVIFDHSKPTTIAYRVSDISRAERLLGFKPEIPLENGISDTIEWYLCQIKRKKIRKE